MWSVNSENINKALAYSTKYNISFYTLLILLNRNVDIKDIDLYLDSSILNFFDKYNLEQNIPEINKASDRIQQACEKKERIFIYGDYDVDGASSTAILMRFFAQFNLTAHFHIPNRFDEGYGITKYGIQKAYDTFAPKLMIVVDCGSSSHEEISFAHSLGIEVIVLDHHIYNTRPKDAFAVINPNFEFLKSQYTNLCASGVVFVTLFNTIIRARKKNLFLWKNISVMNFIDIVTIGTICDCMTLRGINHIIVKKGLQKLNSNTSFTIKRLLDNKDFILIKDISFLIGPRLNAGGRLGKENLATLALIDNSESENIASKLIVLNETRKEVEKNILKKALTNIQVFKYFTISFGENWHEGVIGIIASKIKETYQKPAFVLSLKGDYYIGSARSIKPIHLGEIISAGKNLNVIYEGGGHELAGGISIHKTKIYEFISFLEKYITRPPYLEQFYDCEINLPTIDLINQIKILEPFGNGFDEPKFLIKNVAITTLKITQDKHINILIRKDHYTFKSILFNTNKKIFKEKADIICHIRYNQKIKKIDLFILDIIDSTT